MFYMLSSRHSETIGNQPIKYDAFEAYAQVNDLGGKNSKVMWFHIPSKEIPRTKCQEKRSSLPIQIKVLNPCGSPEASSCIKAFPPSAYPSTHASSCSPLLSIALAILLLNTKITM